MHEAINERIESTIDRYNQNQNQDVILANLQQLDLELPDLKPFSERNFFDYYRRQDICEAVFRHFGRNAYYRGMLAKISRKYNIPNTSVNRWYTKFHQDPTWRPYYGINHGKHLRYFTDEEEAAIAIYTRKFHQPMIHFHQFRVSENRTTCRLRKAFSQKIRFRGESL